MPEPLKNLYNQQLITKLSHEIAQHYPHFDEKAFNRSVFDKSWQAKELKQRMRHIAQSLHLHLPADYKKAISILKPVAAKFRVLNLCFFKIMLNVTA